jgi:hypothetical protein
VFILSWHTDIEKLELSVLADAAWDSGPNLHEKSCREV